MITDRFLILRRNILDSVFAKQRLIKIWKDIVRKQIRRMEILDLFDFYDFHLNIDENCKFIRNEVLSGRYNTKPFIAYQVEKKLGISRHLIMPQPSDVLLLQTITESISDRILKKQPSKRAYYSRDRHEKKNPNDFEFDEYKTWRQQWKKFQKDIYRFTKSKKLIVMTDIANYYDSIRIRELRNIVASDAKIDETTLDFLFRMIESLSWLPDYLPYSNQGLPVINIEAVRLLAHAQLFEIDRLLKDKTKGSFVRWMDDITFATRDEEEAKHILNRMSEMLKSRGLALNLSKTTILTAEQAQEHLLIQENAYIDRVTRQYDNSSLPTDLEEECLERFSRLMRERKEKYWDKVAKRYITLFSKTKSRSILSVIASIYVSYSQLRDSINYYLKSLGYDKETGEIVIKLLSVKTYYDDVTRFALCNTVISWEIPKNHSSRMFAQQVSSIKIDMGNDFNFLCKLWLLTKYGSRRELLNFVDLFQNKWENNYFLRRQVTCIFARLYNYSERRIEKYLSEAFTSQSLEVISVANIIKDFKTAPSIPREIQAFLFPPQIQEIYPFNKYLILCAILNSRNARKTTDLSQKLDAYVKDPFLRSQIKSAYKV